MRQFRLLILMIAGYVASSAVAALPELRLAETGSTGYSIILSEDATVVDWYAAEVLRRYLNEATQAEFPVLQAAPAANHPCIFVGLSESAQRRLGEDEPVAGLAEQEHVCRSKGGDIFLYGEGIHGQLWAVLEFLEGSLGWRWYTPLEEPVVPAHPTLVLEPFNHTRGFSFKYRQTGKWFNPEYYYLNGRNMGWQTAHRNRDYMVSAIPTTRFTHTLMSYIPPSPSAKYANRFEWQDKKNYFETNPEYFSLDEQGKRVPNKQVCLSNAELRAELTRNVLRDVDYARGKGWDRMYVTISAADTPGRFCYCDACVALEQKYQSPGGPIYDYSIELCDYLQVERPGVLVKIPAYRRSQTQRPPALTDREMLPENMIVEFAPIEDPYFSDWLHHADDPKVGETYQDFLGWTRITHHMMSWLYPNPYGTGMDVPVGNVQRIVTMMRLMHQNGVRWFFPDNPFLLYRSGFSELQYYLMFRLMKNIDCDADAVIQEFTDHHYGSAGPMLRKYLGELEQCRIEMELPPSRGEVSYGVSYKSFLYDERTFPYLTAENIHRWQGYFNEMEKLTADEAKALENVQAERRELDLATLARWSNVTEQYPDDYKDHLLIAERVRATNAKLTKRPGIRPVGEAALEEFLFQIKIDGRDAPLPPSLASIDPERIRQYLPRQNARNHPKMIEEPNAVQGYATPVHKPDLPFQFGFYQNDTKQAGPRVRLSLEQITPDKYALYELGQFTVTPDCLIWFSAKSWATHLKVGVRLYEPGAGNQWKAYISMKFEGPTYGGKGDTDRVLVERVILVAMSKDQFAE